MNHQQMNTYGDSGAGHFGGGSGAGNYGGYGGRILRSAADK